MAQSLTASDTSPGPADGHSSATFLHNVSACPPRADDKQKAMLEAMLDKMSAVGARAA